MSSGMISKTVLSASYRHISLKTLEKFPEVLERVSFELGQQEGQFRISMKRPLENPLMTIESFNRQFQPRKPLLHAPCSIHYTFFYPRAAPFSW